MALLQSAPQPPAGPTLLSRAAGQKDKRALKSPPGSPADAGGKGAISLLQEFVQCSKSTLAPQDRPVLQWSFGQRASSGVLEFRATVAFVLDGIPHHAVGGWHPSKKAAQRDAADRVLGYLVGAWGEALLAADPSGAAPTDGAAAAPKRSVGPRFSVPECQLLEDFCARSPSLGGARPAWSIRWESSCACAPYGSYAYDARQSSQCIASVELEILGVRHRLAGVPRSNEQDAMAAAARRVLWYLRAPGFEDAFQLDPQAPVFQDRDIPLPPDNWVSDQAQIEAAFSHQNVA